MNDSSEVEGNEEFGNRLMFRSHNLRLGYFYETRGHDLYVYRNRADSLGNPVFSSPVNVYSAFHSADEKFLVINHGSGAWGNVSVVLSGPLSNLSLYMSENEYRHAIREALVKIYPKYSSSEVIHLRAPIREIKNGEAILYASGEFYLPKSEGGFGQKTFESIYLALNLDAKEIRPLEREEGIRSWYRGKPLQEAIYGSGFFVSPVFVVTNAHVVENAKWVTLGLGNREANGKVVAVSKHFDLALIEVYEGSLECEPIAMASDLTLGSRIRAFGYPLPFLQGYTLKVTEGVISGLFGLNDTPLHFQISAPIQPGNSGGAILNEGNELVGVAVSSLDKVAIARDIGSLPENVNFGIHLDVVRRFLNDHNIVLAKPTKINFFNPELSCVQIIRAAE